MQPKFCENCGAALSPNASFCKTCGFKIDSVAEEDPVIQQAYTPIPPQPQMNQAIPPQSQYINKPRRNGKEITGILIGSILLLAVVMVVVFLSKDSEKAKSSKPSDTKMLTADTAAETPASAAESNAAAEAPASEATPTSELDPSQCSTTDRPETEDFTWFTEKADDWIYGITPADAQMMDAYEKTLGSWKGMEMVYDYDGTLLGYAYFTLTFSGEPEEVGVDIHWHHMQWADGTREELVYREDEKMIGEFAYAGFLLGGPGNQIDLLCYERNGKQYAEGTWTVQSGEEVRVALVRP